MSGFPAGGPAPIVPVNIHSRSKPESELPWQPPREEARVAYTEPEYTDLVTEQAIEDAEVAAMDRQIAERAA